MPITTNFKKGIDLPVWVWMTQCPVVALVSGGFKYDGNRYIYSWNSASIYRFDTWTNGWQFLQTPGVGVAGQDMVYDPVRNVLISVVTATTWQVFNLNSVAVTIAGVSCAAWALTTMTPVLPTALATGAFLVGTKEVAPGAVVFNAVAAPTGNTTTNVRTTTSPPLFYATLVGLQVRVTSGAQAGQVRTISAVVDSDDLTVVPALGGALATGDTFSIECPTGVASAGATTTLTDAAKTWIVNKYANWDVEIMTGTGAGQRRRIASNTATVLTLAAAVTGNPRTGPFTTAPDATSTYRIVPSTDFLYYLTGTTFWRLDIVASPAAAWTALTAHPAGQLAGGGGDYSRAIAPGHIYAVRGGTVSLYQYDIGLNAWTIITAFGNTNDIFSTGSSMVLLSGLGKVVVLNEATTQLFALDLATNTWDLFSNHPYVAGTAVEGKRLEEVVTPDGIRWLYLLRTGGQELFRVAVEWL